MGVVGRGEGWQPINSTSIQDINNNITVEGASNNITIQEMISNNKSAEQAETVQEEMVQVLINKLSDIRRMFAEVVNQGYSSLHSSIQDPSPATAPELSTTQKELRVNSNGSSGQNISSNSNSSDSSNSTMGFFHHLQHMRNSLLEYTQSPPAALEDHNPHPEIQEGGEISPGVLEGQDSSPGVLLGPTASTTVGSRVLTLPELTSTPTSTFSYNQNSSLWNANYSPAGSATSELFGGPGPTPAPASLSPVPESISTTFWSSSSVRPPVINLTTPDVSGGSSATSSVGPEVTTSLGSAESWQLPVIIVAGVVGAVVLAIVGFCLVKTYLSDRRHSGRYKPSKQENKQGFRRLSLLLPLPNPERLI